MPRIEADTVAEHRARQREAISSGACTPIGGGCLMPRRKLRLIAALGIVVVLAAALV